MYYYSNSDLLDPMQGSIKQQNTFTTIAAANVEVIASYVPWVLWMVLAVKLKSIEMGSYSKYVAI